MRKKILGLAALVMSLFAITAMAAHFLGISSVDGREIKYEDFTSFDDARSWAVSQWNALGKVSIAPDDAFSINDMEWTDVNRCDVSWDGRWISYSFADDVIELNACYLNGYTTFNRRTVATHELGHALGIGDHTLSDFGSSAIIMYHCSTCSGVNTPQTHDRNDYNTLWP